MREIKLRFIIKDQRDDTFRTEDLSLEDYGKGLPYLSEYEIVHDRLQWTGLLDKNGKEIYEGDIVKIGQDLIEEVNWVDEKTWMADKCPVNGFVNHESIYKIKPEVIGNIFENPELLN